jgi:hypothetical protein
VQAAYYRTVSFPFRLLGGQRAGLDSSALNLATDDIDRVLSHHDEILGYLVDLLDETGELIGRLYQHLLLCLAVLSHIGLARHGVGKVVKVDRLIFCHGKLTCLKEGGGIGKSLDCNLCGGGRHFCREEGDDISLFFRTPRF